MLKAAGLVESRREGMGEGRNVEGRGWRVE
jgi:hypothetical protein